MSTFTVAACVFACGSGTLLGSVVAKTLENAKRRRAFLEAQSHDPRPRKAEFSDRLLTFLEWHTARLGVTSPQVKIRLPNWLMHTGTSGLDELCVKAGVFDRVSARGVVHARVTLAFFGACIGALTGSLFSAMLALLLACIGFFVGWRIPKRALIKLRQFRTNVVERCISEMLEIIVLGLRSGLSFDQAFDLYHENFSNDLARCAKRAKHRWELGVQRRDESLRSMADEYDSAILARVVESIVRSLRFGTSLADALESQASTARAEHRTRQEERVAKTPIKMMVPVGTLILPAMLLLVLGPILLDLMKGF